MNLLIIFLTTTLYANDYTFDRKSGVLFKKLESIYVYDSEIPRDIHIMIDSTRNKFRESLQADCGDKSTGLPTLEHNFFGLKEERITTESEFCTKSFDTFDNIILSYIGSDLQFSDKYNRTFDSMVEQPRSKRQRRAVALAIGGAAAVTVVASGGMAWYVDAKSQGRDALLAEKIAHERQRITALENVVELMHDELDLAVKKIKRSNAPVITWGGLDIPADDLAIKEILEGERSSVNQFFAEQSREDGRQFVKAALTLTNHRVPLFSSFLDLRLSAWPFKPSNQRPRRSSARILLFIRRDGTPEFVFLAWDSRHLRPRTELLLSSFESNKSSSTYASPSLE